MDGKGINTGKTRDKSIDIVLKTDTKAQHRRELNEEEKILYKKRS